MTDLRQSPNYAQFMQSQGWSVEKIPQFVYIRRIPILGSIIKIQRPQGKLNFQKIDQLAQKHHALIVKLEPPYQFDNGTMKQLNHETIEPLKAKGFYPSSPLLPPKTIWLDLTKSEEQLWQDMSKKTRYCLKKARDQDIKILRYKDIENFHKSFKKHGRGYVPKIKEFQSLVNCFGKNALLLVTSSKYYNTTKYCSKNHQPVILNPEPEMVQDEESPSLKQRVFKTSPHHIQNEIIAGALFLVAGKSAYYFYAFTSPQGRKKFAQYLIIWEAIKELKKRGVKVLDLEGIYDPRFKFTKRWRGFSHFKKSFGGKVVTFPGAFTKYYHPLLKILTSCQRRFVFRR